MSVKRYAMTYIPHDTGGWVKYDDHVAEVRSGEALLDMQREIVEEYRAEVERLRAGEECHVSHPGEGTYECRHDRICPACRLRHAEAEVERLQAWEKRAVASMNAASEAAGVVCCDLIPEAVARLQARVKEVLDENERIQANVDWWRKAHEVDTPAAIRQIRVRFEEALASRNARERELEAAIRDYFRAEWGFDPVDPSVKRDELENVARLGARPLVEALAAVSAERNDDG